MLHKLTQLPNPDLFIQAYLNHQNIEKRTSLYCKTLFEVFANYIKEKTTDEKEQNNVENKQVERASTHPYKQAKHPQQGTHSK